MVGVALSVLLSAGTRARGAFRKRVCRLIECDGVDAPTAAIELARCGHGIICTFENWLDPALKTSNLKPVLPQWWSTFDGPRLYFSSRLMSASLRAFVDLVAEERLKGSA